MHENVDYASIYGSEYDSCISLLSVLICRSSSVKLDSHFLCC